MPPDDATALRLRAARRSPRKTRIGYSTIGQRRSLRYVRWDHR